MGGPEWISEQDLARVRDQHDQIDQESLLGDDEIPTQEDA